jgi:hypothetical protein
LLNFKQLAPTAAFTQSWGQLYVDGAYLDLISLAINNIAVSIKLHLSKLAAHLNSGICLYL